MASSPRLASQATEVAGADAGNLLSGFKLPSWWKVSAFTFNLFCGLVLSQVFGAFLDKQVYKTMHEVVHILTMWALSYIMINVGYEFTVDKKDLTQYAWDYGIAMTAAGFPWLFVALWFMLLVDGMEADQAFLVARFAAPTSAGILFSMLEGAGLRDTWVFSKARILAIFDDLDTILLMIPLKIWMIGFKWELLVVIGIMVILLAFAWRYLHRLDLPYSSAWSIVYAAVVTTCCYALYKVTKYYLPMEAIHIEVLLPAFVVGCMINTPCARHELQLQRQASLKRQESKDLNARRAWPGEHGSDDDGLSRHSSHSELSRHGYRKEESHPHESNWEHNVQTSISMVFMVLVGLSMPPLAGKNAKGDSNMSASLIAVHVLTVSLLMIIGKMFPVLCYRGEASWKERLALCMGMCPRGEVGASIIVISLELGVEGPAVIISMCALVTNLVFSGGFIGSVKLLLKQVATAEIQNTGPQAKSAGSEGVKPVSDF